MASPLQCVSRNPKMAKMVKYRDLAILSFYQKMM